MGKRVDASPDVAPMAATPDASQVRCRPLSYKTECFNESVAHKFIVIIQSIFLS